MNALCPFGNFVIKTQTDNLKHYWEGLIFKEVKLQLFVKEVLNVGE